MWPSVNNIWWYIHDICMQALLLTIKMIFYVLVELPYITNSVQTSDSFWAMVLSLGSLKFQNQHCIFFRFSFLGHRYQTIPSPLASNCSMSYFLDDDILLYASFLSIKLLPGASILSAISLNFNIAKTGIGSRQRLWYPLRRIPCKHNSFWETTNSIYLYHLHHSQSHRLHSS